MSQLDLLKILFVINPGAGAKARVSWEDAIRNYFEDLPHTIEYFIIDEKNDVAALRSIIEKIRPDRVVAVGGDGTVTLVARELLNTEIALGILPAGSANGMAKELNIPQDPVSALDIVVSGRIAPSDLIRIDQKHLCLHLSDIGLNAQLIKYFDEGKLRGKMGYAMVVLKTLWKKRRMHVTIQSGEEEINRSAFMVVLANASKYGTGAVINPDGAIDDGLFEVVVVRRLLFMDLIRMLFKPQPFNPRNIQVFKARSATINTKRKVHFQIDGEYMGKVNHIEAEIMQRSIKLLLPQVAPAL